MDATDEPVEGTRTRDAGKRVGESEYDDRPAVSAYSTTETRTVFTESENGDGWIATDLTVEVPE